MISAIYLLALSASGASALASSSRNDRPSYNVKKTAIKPAFDGTLSSAAWKAAPFSESFIDIRGTTFPTPEYDTKMKMLWDDDYLYLGAVLQERDIWSYITEENSSVYQQNAMEFFIDPNGDGLNYLEFEINPLGTTWTLTVSKPYQFGGAGTTIDIPGMKTAISVKGSMNDPSDRDVEWSVEVALPWSVFTANSMNPGRSTPPALNDSWVLDAGRLDWNFTVADGKYSKSPATNDSKVANNWVWAQTDSLLIHTPDHWGNIVFVA